MKATQLKRSIQTLWQSASEQYRPTIPLDFADFLDKFFYLSPDATNSSGAWECLPYQRRLCYLLQDLDVKKLALVKPAQIGYTQLIRGYVGYEAAHRGRNVCVWQPTSADAREFSNLQIKSMLRDCPDIAKFLRVDYDKKDTDNTTSRRVWQKAVSYFRGATSANEFRRISIDSGLVDEVDGVDANIEGEGSADSLAWSRMYASARPKLILGSTPTIEGESNILRIAQEIDAKFKNYLPCPHCDHYQQLEFGGADADYGLSFEKCSDHRKTADTTQYTCNSCAKTFGYENLREMDERGELRTDTIGLTNEGRYYDLNTGEDCEPPHEAAVYLNGLISYTVSWADGCYQFLKATDSARRGDNSSLVTWTNEWLGQGYTPTQNKDLATWEQVKGRQVDAEVFPNWVSHATQWADVQKDSVHNMVVGWGENERSFVLRYDIYRGDHDTDKMLEQAVAASYVEHRREDGVMIPISASGIDSGYAADTVYKACKVNATKIFPTKGLSTYGKPVITIPNRPNQHGVYVCPMGTDTAKDIVTERLKIDIDGDGKIEFSDHELINDELFRSCTSNIKKTVFSSGKAVERWTLPSGRQDEGLDCLCGNLGMVRLLQNTFNVSLGVEHEEESDDDEEFSIEKLASLARA